MKSKTFTLLLFSLITALFLLTFVSAASLSSIIISQPSSTLHNAGSFLVTFNVTNTGVDASPITWSSSVTSGSATITLPTDTSLIDNQTKTFNATVSFAKHQSGTLAWTITADPSGSGSDEVISFSVPITSTSSLDISNVQTLTQNQNATVNVTNTGNVNFADINLSAAGAFNLSFSSNNFALNAGSSVLVNANALIDIDDLALGGNSVTITAKDVSTGTSDTLTYTVTRDLCDSGNVNASKIDITGIEDDSSDNEWEWKPLDNIEISFEVENNLDKDEDFVAEIALFDSEEEDFVDIDGEESLEEEFSLDEDDSKTVAFKFQVPADLEESDGRYVLFVKAFVDGDEDQYCNSYSAVDVPSGSGENIQIEKKQREVVLEEISFENLVRAGETVTISARAFNIGNEDEDEVKVALTNSKLGLNLESSSFDLDSGDSNFVDFSFQVPENAENGIYALRLTSFFDYKKSSDSYLKSDITEVKITVSGGKNTTSSKTTLAGITASLNSEAKAGSQMEITTTIKNLGAASATFVVGVANYESWANLESISDRIITLNAGESKEITITFDVNKDAAGEQTFTIESRVGDKIESKEVAVEIEESSFLSSLKSSLSNLLGNNSFLWAIGIVNIILIGAIIYIAVKIFRR